MLSATIYHKIVKYFLGFKHLIYNPASKTVIIHCPDYVNPNQNPSEILEAHLFGK